MRYTMTEPCDACPFLATANMKRSFTMRRLTQFAHGAFPCHKTATLCEDDDGEEGGYVANENSQYCAGALIFLEKRGAPNQMMRIAERIRLYDASKLNMKAKVR